MGNNLEGFKYEGEYYAIWENECQELFVELHAAKNNLSSVCDNDETIENLMKSLKQFIIKQ